jgi:hypothetical protein
MGVKMPLFLTIKRKYFNAIICGDKKVEYRSLTPFYKSRIEGKDIDSIHIRAGYSNNCPAALVEVKNINDDSFHKLTGPAYGINLGEVIETINCNEIELF